MTAPSTTERTAYWQEAWSTGDTRWDAGEAAPALVDLLSTNADLPKGRALVPGCGSGYDALALAQAGYTVTALDLVDLAVFRFRELRQNKGLSAHQAEAHTEDFFSYNDEPFSLIWDYTFLCAIPPSLRTAWAEQMARLIAPTGELVTLIFPIRPEDGAGPPFAMSPELVERLLSPYFTPKAMFPVSRSHPARQGREVLARWMPRNG